MTDKSHHGPIRYSPEEWDRLSVEERVRWNDEIHQRSPSNPLAVARYYAEGAYTRLEVPPLVFSRLTTFNVEGFLDQFPAELLAEVQCKADCCPADDDEKAWSERFRLGSSCYHLWLTAEQIREHELEEDRCFRIGLRIYREAVARRKAAPKRAAAAPKQVAKKKTVKKAAKPKKAAKRKP